MSGPYSLDVLSKTSVSSISKLCLRLAEERALLIMQVAKDVENPGCILLNSACAFNLSCVKVGIIMESW